MARKLDSLLEPSSLNLSSPVDDIATALGVSKIAADRLIRLNRCGFAVRLDKEVGEDGDATLSDFVNIGNDDFVDSIIDEDMSEKLLEIIQNVLEPEDLEILLERMGYRSDDDDKVTYAKLGQMHGNLSAEAMRKRTNAIIKKVKEGIKRKYPEMQTLMG